MLFIIDKRIPEESKNKLRSYGYIIELFVNDITYNTIAGHPDIFFCKIGNQLIAAPNLPYIYKELLSENNFPFIIGNNNVGDKYPVSAIYNAVVSDKYLIHKLNITDPMILKYTEQLEKINIEQGYSRCSLVPLKDNHFITSDKGIFNKLSEKRFSIIYAAPDEIILPGFRNGFIGGAFGVYENKIFIIGSLNYLSEGRMVRDYLMKLEYDVIELYDGPLFDGGSIIVI